MAENQQAQQPQQQFGIQSIYVKDISLEMPMGAALYTQQWKPQFNVDLNTTSAKFQENSFEVVLSITVTIKLEEQVAALIEVQQAGLFVAQGFDDETLRRTLGTVAPNALFAYAREAIDSLCNRANIPPVKLQPVNFDMLYMKALQEAQARGNAEAEGAH